MRQGCTDVAKVDFPDLPSGAEVTKRLHHILAHEGPTFEPGPAAQAHAHVGTVGNLESALVTLKVAENAAGHAGQHGHGRIIGMDADPDTLIFSHGSNLPDEIRVVVPDFLLGEMAAVGKGLVEFGVDP